MAIVETKSYSMQCDHCGEFLGNNHRDTDFYDEDEMFEYAKRWNWKINEEDDICPHCQEET